MKKFVAVLVVFCVCGAFSFVNAETFRSRSHITRFGETHFNRVSGRRLASCSESSSVATSCSSSSVRKRTVKAVRIRVSRGCPTGSCPR